MQNLMYSMKRKGSYHTERYAYYLQPLYTSKFRKKERTDTKAKLIQSCKNSLSYDVLLNRTCMRVVFFLSPTPQKKKKIETFTSEQSMKDTVYL